MFISHAYCLWKYQNPAAMKSLTKFFAFSAFLMLTNLPLFSQIFEVRCEGPDQPAFVRFFRGGG